MDTSSAGSPLTGHRSSRPGRQRVQGLPGHAHLGYRDLRPTLPGIPHRSIRGGGPPRV